MTLFTKIINREIDADVVYENEKLIVIKDIAPKAPIHLLIIPKKEISSLQEMEEGDFFLFSDIIKTVQLLAKKYNVENGYRLVINNGKGVGQTVFHLHFHFLGGKTMTEDF